MVQKAKHLLVLGGMFMSSFLWGQDTQLGVTLFDKKTKSGILLELDKSEYKVYNSYYSQSLEFDKLGNKVNSIGGDKTFFTSNFNYFLGADNYLDIGIEASYRIVTTDTIRRNGLIGIGPKVRFQPVGKWKSFLVQTTLLIPTVKDLDGIESRTIFLDFDTYQFVNQFFLDKTLMKGLNLFAEFDILARIDREFNQPTDWVFPTKLFLSTFPFKGTTLYLMGEYSNSSFTAANIDKGYYIQNGVGLKYQLKKLLEFEIGYSKFHMGKNTGAGNNFNFGIKYRN